IQFMSDWNPEQYDRFKRERQQPFFDLLALVRPKSDLTVVDLGCGTGELTHILHERLRARQTRGADNSPAMLAKAEAHRAPGLTFELGDIGEIGAAALAGPFDLVFSNAALHWIDDHEALFGRLARTLAEGGQLAVQMPANFDHPSHAIANAIARE